MEIINIKKNQIIMEISKYELAVFSNSLNEVCNGFKVKGFDTRIGMKIDEARKFLDLLNLVYVELDQQSYNCD